MIDDRVSSEIPWGYVNTFNMTPQWAWGRLWYGPPNRPLSAESLSVPPLSRHFEGCWPGCPTSRVCDVRARCAREAARAGVVAQARFALGVRL